VEIDMHPEGDGTGIDRSLDAIFASPHKLLGGPGSSGLLMFNRKLYHLKVPSMAGGGTVLWTNPWGEQGYISDIEVREDSGTPGFLQRMRAALAVELKEEMGVANIERREKEINDLVFKELRSIPNVVILAGHCEDRVSIFSFFINGLHYNLCCKLLNDRFGIQCRSGCSCAGTYGHVLFHIDREQSKNITNMIDAGDFSTKPGWVRISFHPTMLNKDVMYVLQGVREVANNFQEWSKDYTFHAECNAFIHKTSVSSGWIHSTVDEWFQSDLADEVNVYIRFGKSPRIESH